MKTKAKKLYNAFTLAELMVIMAVMTVVLAAVAPIFTSRYSNVSYDNVWSLIGASNNNDIYNDAPGRSMMAESLIGITPIDMEDVRRTYAPYSKVIIRSSDRINSNKQQRQIEFKYGNNTTGYLFAGNYNLLLGGMYNNTKFNYNKINPNNPTVFTADTTNAVANTALGSNAMTSLSTGKYNSAFGYKALSDLTTGEYNTAVGVLAGSSVTAAKGNVLIGYHSYDAATGDYNTVIGHNNSSVNKSVAHYNTAIGNNIYVKGEYNTAIGDSSNAVGKYNTAIGYASLNQSSPTSSGDNDFQYNTAVGYKSCSGIGSNSKYTTCIGGVGVDSSKMSSSAQGFFNDSHSRVLIGSPVTKYKSAATLEVHNLTTTNSKYPYPAGVANFEMGDSSVIVNGNLIVRGQSYFLGKSPFPMSATSPGNNYANTMALMGFKLFKESVTTYKPYMGFDGSEPTIRIRETYMHEKYAGREHCICAYSCSNSSKDYYSAGHYGRDTYDWSYLNYPIYHYVYENPFGGYNYFWGTSANRCGTTYNDNSDSSNNIELSRSHNITDGGENSPGALLYGGSCCPILNPGGVRFSTNSVSSDRNLKNIFDIYTSGLDSLSKLKIYDYYFNSDDSKSIHTGVIAQDLKRIFPTSVSKRDDGYLKIRWDEMFYAAINSVKQLHKKVIKLAQNADNNITRINKLKKDNEMLENKVLELSKELDKLEK